MALKNGDLQDTMLHNVSIDEFEPKTGGLREVSVVGFFVRDRNAGNDLYRFINNSVIDTRDVELTPNPTEDGYYMVFAELERDQNLYDNIQSLLDDVSNVSGKMKWHFKTHLMDDFVPWQDRDSHNDVFFDNPASFLTVEQYQHKLEEEALLAEQQRVQSIHEFFRSSALEDVQIDEDTIRLVGGGDVANFRIVGFGESSEVMQQIGIHETALGHIDVNMKRFNHMLGEMSAMPVGDYVVMYRPNDSKVMVGKAC